MRESTTSKRVKFDRASGGVANNIEDVSPPPKKKSDHQYLAKRFKKKKNKEVDVGAVQGEDGGSNKSTAKRIEETDEYFIQKQQDQIHVSRFPSLIP